MQLPVRQHRDSGARRRDRNGSGTIRGALRAAVSVPTPAARGPLATAGRPRGPRSARCLVYGGLG